MNVYSFARELGLYVGTWSPGDGMTRYRFFRDGVVTAKGEYVQDFNSSDGLFTAGGRKEALVWLRGYRKGREVPTNPDAEYQLDRNLAGWYSNPYEAS